MTNNFSKNFINYLYCVYLDNDRVETNCPTLLNHVNLSYIFNLPADKLFLININGEAVKIVIELFTCYIVRYANQPADIQKIINEWRILYKNRKHDGIFY